MKKIDKKTSIYFDKIIEYLDFVKKNGPLFFEYCKNQFVGKVKINGEEWEMYSHGGGVNALKISDGFEIDFDLYVFSEIKYYEMWKFSKFMDNQIKLGLIDENLFSKDDNIRKREYETCNNNLLKISWVSERKGLINGFYVSRVDLVKKGIL